MTLFDSHAEHPLIKEGNAVVCAGLCINAAGNLMCYSNLASLMQFEEEESDS